MEDLLKIFLIIIIILIVIWKWKIVIKIFKGIFGSEWKEISEAKFKKKEKEGKKD